jgi:hypothetical protein
MIYLKVIGKKRDGRERREKLTFNHASVARFSCRFISLSLLLSFLSIFLFVVIDPQLSILQGSELFIEVGSNLNLTCYIKQTQGAEELGGSALRWLHNNQVGSVG